MVAFDVYHSVGPNVDVQLFGQAAEVGTKLGQQIPSPITSAITGAMSGYKYGLDVEAESQQNELRQNAIDQLPVTNAQQEAQAKNAQAIAQINSLKAQVDSQTQDLTIQDTEAQLTNERDKLNQVVALRTKTNDFNTRFQNASPQDKASLVLGGNYNDVFAADRNLFQTSLASVYATPDNGLDAATRAQVGQILKVHTIQDSRQKLADQRLPEFEGAHADLLSSPLTSALTKSGELTVPIEQYPGAVEFQQAGRYLVNPDTKQVFKNADGSWMEDPQANSNAETRDKYDVFGKDGKLLYSGKNDFAGITVQGRKDYDNFVKELSIQNGTQTRLAIDQAVNPKTDTVKQRATAIEVPTLSSTSAEAPKFEGINSDPFARSLKQKLNLDDTALEAIKEPFDSLKTQLTVYANSASYRNSPTAIKQINETVTTMAKNISDTRFNSSSALKAQYTPADVTAYNTSLLNKLIKTRKFSVSALFNPTEPTPEDPLYNAFEVQTPEDLYFVSQQKAIEAPINEVVKGWLQNQQLKQEQPVNAQISRNKNLSFLSKNASGNQ